MTRLLKPRFFYGWLIVAVAGMISFAEVGTWNPVLSVFVKPMADEFGWSRGTISGAVTVGAIIGGLLAVFIGPIIDKWGAKVVLVPGLLVLGSSLALLSRINELWQFYLLFALGRLVDTGVTGLAVNVAVSNWFVEKRGRAVGVVELVRRTGSTILPLVVQYIILVYSWRSAWLFLGTTVLFLTVVPTALILRRRPEDMGLRPDGRPAETFPTSSSIATGLSRDIRGNPIPEPIWTRSAAVRTRALWLLTLAAAQLSMAMGGINLHQVPFLMDNGIPGPAAVGALSVLAFSAALSGLLWGFLAEKTQVRHLLALSLLGSAVGVIFLLAVKGMVMTYAYAVFYGVALGGVQTTMSLVWPDYFGRLSLGAIRGVVAPFQFMANAMGPLFAGWIFDATGSYNPAFITFAALYFVAAGWVALARMPVAPAVRKTLATAG